MPLGYATSYRGPESMRTENGNDITIRVQIQYQLIQYYILLTTYSTKLSKSIFRRNFQAIWQNSDLRLLVLFFRG